MQPAGRGLDPERRGTVAAAADIARFAIEKPIELVEIRGAESLDDSATDARQDGEGVRPGHVRQQWREVDDEGVPLTRRAARCCRESSLRPRSMP